MDDYNFGHLCNNFFSVSFVVQLLSRVWLFVTPWTSVCQAPLSSTISWSSNSCPSRWSCYLTISPSAAPPLLLPSIFPSIRIFSVSQLFSSGGQSSGGSASASVLQRTFRVDSLWIDWFDLLAVQGTLNSVFQHHSLKASILWHSAFFMVQLSHPYMRTGKTIALTIRTFVSEVMSLLFCFLFLNNISYRLSCTLLFR